VSLLNHSFFFWFSNGLPSFLLLYLLTFIENGTFLLGVWYVGPTIFYISVTFYTHCILYLLKPYTCTIDLHISLEPNGVLPICFFLNVNSILNYRCLITVLKYVIILFRNIMRTPQFTGFFPDLDSLKCELWDWKFYWLLIMLFNLSPINFILTMLRCIPITKYGQQFTQFFLTFWQVLSDVYIYIYIYN